jgi:hypothetical protein
MRVSDQHDELFLQTGGQCAKIRNAQTSMLQERLALQGFSQLARSSFDVSPNSPQLRQMPEQAVRGL